MGQLNFSSATIYGADVGSLTVGSGVLYRISSYILPYNNGFETSLGNFSYFYTYTGNPYYTAVGARLMAPSLDNGNLQVISSLNQFQEFSPSTGFATTASALTLSGISISIAFCQENSTHDLLLYVDAGGNCHIGSFNPTLTGSTAIGFVLGTSGSGGPATGLASNLNISGATAIAYDATNNQIAVVGLGSSNYLVIVR